MHVIINEKYYIVQYFTTPASRLMGNWQSSVTSQMIGASLLQL